MMFRKETEFQETEIGKLPKGWKIKRLGEIAKIVNGVNFPLKLQGKKNGKYPFIKVNDMNNSYKYIFNAENYVDDEDLPKLKAKPFPKNTIIFPKIGMAIRLNKYRILGTDALFDNNTAGIITNENVAYYEFIYYYLQGNVDLITLANTTTVPAISKSRLEGLYIPLPPLEEQKRIADILSMIDSGIEIVDRAVAKLEGMKRALLNELLTGRIRVREENGKSTFYKETEFQDTEIGRIPKDWYVKRLKEVADFQRGFSYKSDEKFTEEVPDGYLFLTLNSVKEGGGLKEDGWTWIKSDRLEERHFVKEGDIVIANTEQSKDGSLLGSPAIVHFPEWYKKDKAVFSHHISRLLLKINNIDVNFLFYYLSFVQPIARKYHTGTGVWGLDVDKWSTDLLIPLPPIKEQTAIAEILSTVDKAIELYRKEKERLLRLKRGLMSVLLTGRVRVIGDVKNVGVVT